MKLKAGTIDDFENSMAAAIEHAFETVWKERKGFDLSDTSKEDRRMLFTAVAQGVVKHLQATALETFAVSVSVDQTFENGGPAITSRNETGTVIVTQDENTSNHVKSTGSGTVTMNTEGDLYP